MTRNKLVLAGALALVLACPAASIAGEPGNNTPPWRPMSSFAGTADVFTTVFTANEFGSWAITPSGDVDYYIASCGGPPNNLGNVKEVQLRFTHAKGDLDMAIYSADGTFLAASTGVTDTETINVAAQRRGAVVIKVYGFNGYVNPSYRVNLACQ